MTLDTYKSKVREAALRRTGEPLYNGSLEHASVLVEAMFEHGNRCVRIFSGRLNANVYGTNEVVEKARLFLSDPSRRIEILLDDPDGVDRHDHPFVSEFKNNDDVDFKFLPKELADRIRFHFTVMDNDSYRFEEDKAVPSAIAAFGDSEGAGHLSGVYDSLWNIAEPCDFSIQ